MLPNITLLYKKYLHILYHLQGMKMIFFKVFLICTLKNQNLVENLTNLAENILKVGHGGVDGVFFFQLRELEKNIENSMT